MHRLVLDDSGPPDVLQARERRFLVEQGLVGQLAEAEELPPRRLLLAPVPLEHVGQQPPRLLLVGAPGAFEWNAFEQRVHDLADLAVLFGDRLARQAFPDRRPREGCPLRLHAGAHVLEPAVQPEGGHAVVAVVGRDDLPDIGVDGIRLFQLEGALHDAKAHAGVVEIGRPLEIVERLELLDRVLLDARAQRLLDDRMEIDEQPGAQHAVDLVLARRVAAHQTLDRRRLVGGEVIDVEIAVPRPALHDEIDERLERRSLRDGIERPERVIDRASRAVLDDPAEQVLAPRRTHEGIPFEIEEHVARRGRGQSLES